MDTEQDLRDRISALEIANDELRDALDYDPNRDPPPLTPPKGETIRMVRADRLEEAAATIARLTAENERLRANWAWCYAGALLYADDGELQDNRAMPLIDFKRDSVLDIESKMRARGEAALSARQNGEEVRDG